MQTELMKVLDLGKSFGNREVLKRINMSINEGEIFALMVPSGVGKTTLFRILNLQEKPSEGRLFFRGIELTDYPTREKINTRRSMSMLFQTPCILNTTVFNNVAYGLVIRKVDTKTLRKKVMNALSIVGLEGTEGQKARTLSGGEAQRMAFARGIVYDPDILLLDEPTSSLDPSNVAMIEEMIKRIRREQGTTIVIATHNVYQVKRIADRVGILLNGELIEVNSIGRIFEAPEDARTKAFINGEMIY